MPANKRILKLKGKVQHYAWGGYDYIPGLLKVPNPDRRPCAEYWMGAHPGAPSEIMSDSKSDLLSDLIAKNPEMYLGEAVLKAFGELPYLFKILDVKDILSIQVHPTKEEAVKGFKAEEVSGIPLTASNRNYKDKNHKPEVMVALSDFWLLHGFKPKKELQTILYEVPEFGFLAPIFGEDNYFDLYRTVMEFSQKEVDKILLPLVNRELNKQQHLPPAQPGYWVNKLFENGRVETNIDRGIFSIYFFNIVQLHPGQAIFQGAGIPHAYLQGQNVELMANSDNVLRGGLTSKHIDVHELLKHTLFVGIEPNVLKGEVVQPGEINYHCPVKDFGISAIKLAQGNTYTSKSASAEIFIVIEGEVMCNDAECSFFKGQSFLVLPETEYTLAGTSGALLYKAFVPQTTG